MPSKTKTLTYSEKLRDPRWQKMRLQIMERDKFTCQHCGGKEKTLNVHHHFYKKGAMPWEYEDDMLTTLCEDCHRYLESRLRSISKAAGQSLGAGLLMLQIPAMINEEGPYSEAHSLFVAALDTFVAYSEPWSLGYGTGSLEYIRDAHKAGMGLITAITSLCNFLDESAIAESLREVEE